MGVLLVALLVGFVATSDGFFALQPEIEIVEVAVVSEEPVFERGRYYEEPEGYYITDLSTPPDLDCYAVSDDSPNGRQTISICEGGEF